MFNKFREHIRKYWKYSFFSAKTQLKAEVANSYLNWLWWILDPLSFMFIYTFIFGYVFQSAEPYFPLFIFIGLTLWEFFNKNLTQSVKLVKNKKSVISKVYIPKYILLIIKIYVNAFKFGISLIITIIMLFAFKVPVTYNVVFTVPIFLTLGLLSFGLGCFLMHYGVFVEDLSNVVRIILRILFYLTGIFWNIQQRLPAPYGTLVCKLNPVAFLLTSMRECILYSTTPDLGLLAIWFLVSLIISALGIRLIYKYENSYVKLI